MEPDLLPFSEAVYSLERELKKRMGKDVELIEARRGTRPNEYVILWRHEGSKRYAHDDTRRFNTHAMWIGDDPARIGMEWGHYDMEYEEARIDFHKRVPYALPAVPMVD